jgi:hypothetical protein
MVRTLKVCREAASQISDAQLQLESMGFISDLVGQTEEEVEILSKARLQPQQQQQPAGAPQVELKQELVPLQGNGHQAQHQEQQPPLQLHEQQKGSEEVFQAARKETPVTEAMEVRDEGGGPPAAVLGNGVKVEGEEAGTTTCAAGEGGVGAAVSSAALAAAPAAPSPATALSSEDSKLPQLLADAEDLCAQLEEWCVSY